MSRLFDRLFGAADDDEPEEQTGPRFLDIDPDDLWGQRGKPPAEPEAADTGDTLFHDFNQDDPFGRIYYPLDDNGKIVNPLAAPQPEASTDNLTFVQYQPPEEPPPSPAPRPREIGLWGIDNPYRDAQDWRYEAFRWPADAQPDPPDRPHVPTPDEQKAAFMDGLSGEYDAQQRERIADLWDEAVSLSANPVMELPEVELPDIPEIPEPEIALVVGFEETPTSGEVHVYYQPTQSTRDNEEDDEEDDELT